MPFANLPTHEKDAFFSLLDEYFTSRPDLLSRIGGGGRGGAGAAHSDPQLASPDPTSGAAIASAAQRAIAKNPVAASRLLAAGINHANSSPGGSGNTTAAAGNQTLNPGRVAAAAQAFSGPPTKPSSPPVAQKGPDANKPASQKKFGDVDVSSTGAMFRSLRGSTAAKNAPPPTVYTPPAFAGKKASGLPPPPIRRVSTAAHVPEPEEDATAQQPESTEEEGAGEWAEALYDYTSQEASDLYLRAGERVLVTEKTSSDWWTGQVDGRSGLFPALYVKLL